MSARIVLSDAAIETMLARRSRRADPGDLAEVVLDAIWRTPPRPARPWDWLSTSPRLAPALAHWLWVAIAAALALALVGGLLAVGALRLLERPYPILTGAPELGWTSQAVSGDELWTVDESGMWHYVDGSWQPPPDQSLLAGQAFTAFVVASDGALWVSGERTIAVFRDGAWRAAWETDPSDGGPRALVAGPGGTVWVAQRRELVSLTWNGSGYAAHTVTCPQDVSRFAVTTDGTVYAGSITYSDGVGGLVRSDGVTCRLIDPLGDGQLHQVSELSAGPAGSLLATVFDDEGNGCPCRVWLAMLRDGRWSTISGPTLVEALVSGQAIDRDGHPWRIDRDGGLERYERGGWRVVADSVRSIAMAPDGVLWYETNRGLERIRTNRLGD